ncbi:HNH endonuclease [Shewanella sp. cp20]|uniref:HNH endonuclease n=1 Tax=Shewanella sp. cp20 TaxID=1521167 RepID=UPI00069BF86A|nr:HNH endonuclease [Shewanella sp. cp20]
MVSWGEIFLKNTSAINFRACSANRAWRRHKQFTSVENALIGDKGASHLFGSGGDVYDGDGHKVNYGIPYFCAIWFDGEIGAALLLNDDRMILADKECFLEIDEWDQTRSNRVDSKPKEIEYVVTRLKSIFNQSDEFVNFTISNVEEMIFKFNNLKEVDDNYKSNVDASKTECETSSKSRIGQNKFRKKLIDYWGGCSISNSKNLSLLKASHIKPWMDSNDDERLDVYNGLLLMPGLDSAFDAGFISFDDNGSIIISESLDYVDKIYLGIIRSDLKVLRKFECGHIKYLEFHREYVFESWRKVAFKNLIKKSHV